MSVTFSGPPRPRRSSAPPLVVLDALEHRQHVLPAPAAIAELRPVVIVLPLAAHPHHAVDGARPAEHFSTRHRNLAAAGVVLRLGLVEPVHAGPVDEAREADRHARERMRLAAGFQQQHLVAAAFGQAIGERGAGRACTDDDVVGRERGHSVPSDSFVEERIQSRGVGQQVRGAHAGHASRAHRSLKRCRPRSTLGTRLLSRQEVTGVRICGQR